MLLRVWWNRCFLISERECGQIWRRRRRIRGNDILSWKWKEKKANPTHWWIAHLSERTEIVPKRSKRLPLWSLAYTLDPGRPHGGGMKCLSCEIHHQNSWRHMTTCSGTVMNCAKAGKQESQNGTCLCKRICNIEMHRGSTHVRTHVQTLAVWCLLYSVTMVTVAQEVKEWYTGWKRSIG